MSAAMFSFEELNFYHLVLVTESTFSDWRNVVQCRDIDASIRSSNASTIPKNCLKKARILKSSFFSLSASFHTQLDTQFFFFFPRSQCLGFFYSYKILIIL